MFFLFLHAFGERHNFQVRTISAEPVYDAAGQESLAHGEIPRKSKEVSKEVKLNGLLSGSPIPFFLWK